MNRFVNGDGSEYYSEIMSEKAIKKTKSKNFIKQFGERLEEEIEKQLKENGSFNRDDIGIIKLVNLRPQFNTRDDNWQGLRIMMNDTEHAVIYRQALGYDTKTKVWEGTFYIEIFDHFGLDDIDLNKFQNVPGVGTGFASWWLLQHHRGKKPFRTQMKWMTVIKGKL